MFVSGLQSLRVSSPFSSIPLHSSSPSSTCRRAPARPHSWRGTILPLLFPPHPPPDSPPLPLLPPPLRAPRPGRRGCEEEGGRGPPLPSAATGAAWAAGSGPPPPPEQCPVPGCQGAAAGCESPLPFPTQTPQSLAFTPSSWGEETPSSSSSINSF